MISSAISLPLRPSQSVMILDDDTFLLDLMSDMLIGQGVSDIRALSDGHLALATLQERSPDILLCDLNMPDIDGIEFIRQLAKQGYAGEIIVMSSANMVVLRAAESLAVAHGLKFISVLPKPFDTRSLVAALSRSERYNPAHVAHENPIEPLKTEELRAGLNSGCITLEYQPKVATRGRKVLDVECLARWRHPERGVLPPSAFINLAEEQSLIDELTLVVLRQAAVQLNKWNQSDCNIRLAVNVSMDSLKKLDLPEIFEAIVRAEGVQPDQFVLEITESKLMSNLTMTLDILTRLRIKGFDLAIDDFGTGYSTLDNLRQLPFSELKLDRSFISGVVYDKTMRAILESSVRLGKALNLNLVAEGVETREEWDLICAMGCNEVQGFFISPPMVAEHLQAWIERWEKGEVDHADIPCINAITTPGNSKVLLVDRDDHLRADAARYLGQHFQILTAESGEAALKIARSERPDMILLEINLQGMDGFETCHYLKEDERTAAIPVIFISAYDMLEEKLKGYEAGGLDFLIKPIDPPEVKAKIEHVIDLKSGQRQLLELVTNANTTAMVAMTNMGELGTLLNAFRTFNACTDYGSLADAMLLSLQQFGLSGVVQIRTSNAVLTRNELGIATPLEVAVIEHMANMDRIFQFKSKMSYTYDSVSLMVNNAPVEDADRCGRLRDHLAMLVESAEMRARSIINSNELLRRENITRAIDRVTGTLMEVDQLQRDSKMAMYLATTGMKDRMEQEVWSLGLTDDQDTSLAIIISRSIENILDIQSCDTDIQNKLTTIVTELNNLQAG